MREQMTALERFLKYITFDTQSEEVGRRPLPRRNSGRWAGFWPGSWRRWAWKGPAWRATARSMGGSLATPGREDVPVIALIAHMDTAPRVPGGPMKARVVSYEGGVLVLNEEKGIALSPAAFPDLLEQVGKQLVVTDGTTLLGADDKAGVAEIFAAVERLVRDPRLAHGRVAVCITPDEEVGRGADYVDRRGWAPAVCLYGGRGSAGDAGV